ncbi:hypothetical protein QR680_017757 [Steinernema hermaphroditum]|uniref:USP domain-containing protein n=1 Tax=Steinernema hermaphroditum TaxID=289476 RepID=A0AA39HGW9_9BILA|nr:hypothetical protein QR680_017757 [Steinernema hermaphroditum]
MDLLREKESSPKPESSNSHGSKSLCEDDATGTDNTVNLLAENEQNGVVDYIFPEKSGDQKEQSMETNGQEVVVDPDAEAVDMLNALLKVVQDEKFNKKIATLDQLYYNIYHSVINDACGASRDLVRPNTVNVAETGVAQTYPTVHMKFGTFLSWATEVVLVKTLFRNNLHTTVYVERVERILRVLLATSKFRLEDFDVIWNIDTDAHDAIQRNIYDLIARLATFFDDNVLKRLSKGITERWKAAESYRDRKNLFDLMHKICYDQLKDVYYTQRYRVHGTVHFVLESVWNLLHMDETWATKLLRLHVELLERIVEVHKASQESLDYISLYCCKNVENMDEQKTIEERFLAFRYLACLMTQKSAGSYIADLFKRHKREIDILGNLFSLGREMNETQLDSEEYLVAIFAMIEFCERNGIPLRQFSKDIERIIGNSVRMICSSVSDTNGTDMRNEPPNETVLRFNFEILRHLFALLESSKAIELATGKNGLIEVFLYKSVTMSDLPVRQREMTFSTDILSIVANLLVDISWLSPAVFKTIASTVQNLFSHNGDLPTEFLWDFEPKHFVRRTTSFVGLKNGGATCYMNAIFQQIFWAHPIRRAILDIDLSLAPVEKQGPEPSPHDIEMNEIEPNEEDDSVILPLEDKSEQMSYACQILQAVQNMFVCLEDKQLAFYNPKEFWDIFKAPNGLVVSTRVQEDANEFWIRLAETIDDAFKQCGQEKIFEKVFGGVIALQKVGIDCVHRFENEDTFMQFTIDVLSHQRLTDSLQQYVNGERMDNDNAYYCAKCEKNVTAIRRECFKKLPPILAFHLKRFGYDWDRTVSVKSNDYFEFPMELDMYPYTVEGVEEKEAKSRSPDGSKSSTKGSIMYRLKGVVVHAGESEGGHYYSFIRLSEDEKDSSERWYKFDDIDICESSVGPEQWFGGEQGVSYELFRNEGKRQKRRYNAYILLYEHIGDELLVQECPENSGVPKREHYVTNVEQCEKLEKKLAELQRLHIQAQYSDVYFYFMTTIAEKVTERINLWRKRVVGKEELLRGSGASEYLLAAVELFSYFLFSNGLHSHRVLQRDYPTSNELPLLKRWRSTMLLFLEFEVSRNWFMVKILMHRRIIQLYLLEAPVTEIRVFMSEIMGHMMTLCERTLFGPMLHSVNPQHEFLTSTFFDQSTETVTDVIIRVLMTLPHNAWKYLLKHPDEYFQALIFYCTSAFRRELLIRHEVLFKFLVMCLDDTHMPFLIRTSRNILQLVSLLLRSLHVFNSLRGSVSFQDNPYRIKEQDEGIQMPQNVANVFATVDQMKKLISLMLEECVRSYGDLPTAYEAMAFLSFENILICKRLFCVFNFEASSGVDTKDVLENYLRCFFSFITIPDTCTRERMRVGLFGEPGGFRGYLHIIADNLDKHYGRAYLMLKKLLNFLSESAEMHRVLEDDLVMFELFQEIVVWFDSQMSKKTTGGSGWTYEPRMNDLTSACRSRLARTTSALNLLVENEIVVTIVRNYNKANSTGHSSDTNGSTTTVIGNDDIGDLPLPTDNEEYTDVDDWNPTVYDERLHQISNFDHILGQSGSSSGGRLLTSPEPGGDLKHQPPSPAMLRRCVAQENVNLSPVYDEQNYDLYALGLRLEDEEEPERDSGRNPPTQPASDDDFENPPEPDADCMNDASDGDEDEIEGNYDRMNRDLNGFRL